MLINHENSQKIAERIGGILHRNVNIMDEEGRIVASTDPTRIGALHELLACEFGRDIADKVFFRNARDFFERVESV